MRVFNEQFTKLWLEEWKIDEAWTVFVELDEEMQATALAMWNSDFADFSPELRLPAEVAGVGVDRALLQGRIGDSRSQIEESKYSNLNLNIDCP